MRETLYKLLEGASSDVTMLVMLQRLSVALVLGLILYVTYRLSFSSVTYNRKFNTSLIMIGMVTTAVMMVIGSSVALSLGMVGALSIVRFRTAIKDPRDAAYIFWSIAIGLCAGTGNFSLGVGTTLAISVVLLFAGVGLKFKKDIYIVVIRGDRSEEENIMGEVNKTFKTYLLKSKHTTETSLELVYQVKMKNGDDKGFAHRLYKLHGMRSINILAQSGETIG
ncbi:MULTISPECIES: DUF4956 domain-containing protein [unclassified Fusibacter]|uniref:DUF4956 domain-containing protein n=1 Tax=unclassified Fusibacter TaxID=2624464 RepID=UPI0010129944|nr:MULTISPECIES: DUF4956 domain-containing protein [unclassified Fusibacter]MCK8059605.1 DUF4956 domain-containing protein [Fusibacter sp. A2]NPE21406.1 DUF4956 domain-containing protein [Fusibacter sp. A1]RXV61821.1 DUF4956 domain-containing protein [Fusibacter sp. A1]